MNDSTGAPMQQAASEAPHISVVIPLYRCAECLPELVRRLTLELGRINERFEIILVNDASPANDWEIAQELAAADARVKGINLSRNFGQHTAITAGLDHTRGDWVVVMDGDLQHPPEEIGRLHARAQEGFDIVFARLPERKDHFLKKLASGLFRRAYNSLSELKAPPNIQNFSISSKAVIEQFRRVTDSSRSFGLIILWLGFRVGFVDVEHSERFAGRSSYTLARSIALAIDSVVSQSTRPLRLSIGFGLLMCAFSCIFALYLTSRYIFYGVSVPGWTSVMVSIYFVGGLLLANLGVLGLYLGKVFDESKRRPLYVVRETLNLAVD